MTLKAVGQKNDLLSLGEHSLRSGDMQKALGFAVQELQQNLYSKEAYTLAGRVMQAVGDWPNAENYYLRALGIDPFYKLPQILFMEHYLNKNFEGYDEALRSILQHIPDHLFAIDMLIRHYYGYHQWQNLYSFVDQVLAQENVPIAYKYNACNFALIAKFITGDLATQDQSRVLSFDTRGFTEMEREFVRLMQIYYHFVTKLVLFRKEFFSYYENPPEDTLHVIGESHALSAAHLNVTLDGKRAHCSTHHVVGLKAYHFSKRDVNAHIFIGYFERVLTEIPKSSKIVVMVGEIDCRLDEGILPYCIMHKTTVSTAVDETVYSYVKALSELNVSCRHDIILCTVPPINIVIETELNDRVGENPLKNIQTLKEVVHSFNQSLKQYAEHYHFRVLDTYTENVAENGFAKPEIHIDAYHLKPDVIVRAAEKIPECSPAH